MINSFNRAWIFSLALSFMTITGVLSAQDCTTVGNNLISNCSFETGALSPWTSAGTVVAQSPGGQQGSYFARLFTSSRIDQSFNLTAGVTYFYSFWYGVNAASSSANFQIRITSPITFVVGPTVLPNTGGGYVQVQGTFVVGTSGNYSIGFLSGSTPILNIDNVIVAAVPEPASLLLLGSMGSAVVGYGLKRARLRK